VHSEDKCNYRPCDAVPTLFHISPRGLKFWYCAEHYDVMAAFYKKLQNEEESFLSGWARSMVETNGW
jgi:predicted RNA-binding protein